MRFKSLNAEFGFYIDVQALLEWPEKTTLLNVAATFCLLYICALALLKWVKKTKAATLLNVAANFYLLTTLVCVGSVLLHAGRIYDIMRHHPLTRLPEYICGVVARLLQLGTEISAGPLLKLASIASIAICVFGNENRDAVAMISLCAPAFLPFIIDGGTNDVEERSSVFTHGRWQLIGEGTFSLDMTRALPFVLMAGAVQTQNFNRTQSFSRALSSRQAVPLGIVFYKFVELPLYQLIPSHARFSRSKHVRVGSAGRKPVTDTQHATVTEAHSTSRSSQSL
ncbi:hypothetical protein [Burkholderia plantarii]|uniref:hypothetical protein n=1 Tax=Burkholderia plantarii TaxID=41899 RepID=UPI0011DF2386|nr:hypothetical protein [Burkholderia plantarii]GLZ19668.1 hypothetical protein Bpla01_31980 [Burkholderia plantarii]